MKCTPTSLFSDFFRFSGRAGLAPTDERRTVEVKRCGLLPVGRSHPIRSQCTEVGARDDNSNLCVPLVVGVVRSSCGQLYREAGYWRCESLKRAIEEQIHLYRSTFEIDESGGVRRQKGDTEVGVLYDMVAVLMGRGQTSAPGWLKSRNQGERLLLVVYLRLTGSFCETSKAVVHHVVELNYRG